MRKKQYGLDINKIKRLINKDKETKWTIQGLAVKIGVSRDTVKSYEKLIPDTAILFNMCEIATDKRFSEYIKLKDINTPVMKLLHFYETETGRDIKSVVFELD